MLKKKFLIALFLVMVTGIGIVSAETLSGTLGGESGVVQGNYYVNGTSNPYANNVQKFLCPNIEYTQNLASVVIFDDPNYVGNMFYYGDNATSTGNTTQVHFHIDSTSGAIIGNGTLGFSRSFSGSPPTANRWGYLYVVMSDWNPGTATGSHYVFPDNNAHTQWSDIYGPIMQTTGLPNGGDLGNVYWYGSYGYWAGTYITLRSAPITVDYTATKPGGTGITGNVTKTLGSSQVYVINAATENILKSDYTISSIPWSFDLPAETIYFAAKSSAGTWYNSSNLFSVGGVTPTPTPTAGTTPIPGYVRSTVYVWDENGAIIKGADISIKDVEASTWHNSTQDTDGIYYIDTLPYHTIDIYANYSITGSVYSPNSVTGQSVDVGDGVFYVTLYPYSSGAGEGEVTLYVELKDSQTKAPLRYATVGADVLGGYSYSQGTGTIGSAVFTVPNETNIRITGTLSGYMSSSRVITTGASGSTYSTVIELSRQYVTATPTSTIPPGGVTPVRTLDTRTNDQKDMAMMDKVRDSAPTLIDLAILVTMISLLGLIAKGWK